jgi:hypothetical protein
MLLLLLLVAAAAEPTIEPIAEGAFRISLDAAPAEIGPAQARLAPAAARACGDRAPVFGRFRYTGTAAPLALEQELLCLPGAAAPVPAAAKADPDWQPDAVLQARLLAASYAYFAAKDAARYADAYRQLTPRLQASSPAADWTRIATEFNAEAGPVRGRRIVEISWYNHPADAPEPGIYVAADYSAEFDKLEFVCGYLMWRLQPDGSFRLAREEQNLVHKRGKPMAPIDRDPLRARLGCKD